jgi:hypothetical protein
VIRAKVNLNNLFEFESYGLFELSDSGDPDMSRMKTDFPISDAGFGESGRRIRIEDRDRGTGDGDCSGRASCPPSGSIRRYRMESDIFGTGMSPGSQQLRAMAPEYGGRASAGSKSRVDVAAGLPTPAKNDMVSDRALNYCNIYYNFG